MELTILENKGNKLMFQLIGADHSICNSLKKELLTNSDVEVATYAVEHPQIGIPKFLIETKKSKPQDALKKALDGLKKTNKDFLSVFQKAAK